MDCCEFVANGYMDCRKCHENIKVELNVDLSKKLNIKELEAIRRK